MSDLWSRLTHQLLGRLKSTISNLQIYIPKKANSEKLGLGIDNPCSIVFFEFADEQVLGEG
jgi:cyanophycinase-like exopeptidase